MFAIGLHFLPQLAAWQLRRVLADAGYPDARFDVVDVSVDRIELRDVELAPGLAFREVAIDAGIALLWRDPHTIRVSGARVVAGDARYLVRARSGELPFRRIVIADSTLVIGGDELAITGTLALDQPHGDLLVTGTHGELRDLAVRMHDGLACASARLRTTRIAACATLASWQLDEIAVMWSAIDPIARAHGWARVAWADDDVVVRAAHGEAAIARWSRPGLAIADATLALDFAGTRPALAGHGEVRVARADLADGGTTAMLADIVIPIAVRATTGSVEVLVDTLRADRADARISGNRVRARSLAVVAPQPLALPALANTLQWSAGELDIDDVRVIGASGTFARSDHAVSWQAERLRWRELVAMHPRGTITGSRYIAWATPALRWRDVAVRDAAGTFDTYAGAIAWHAPALRWRDLEVTAPAGTIDTNAATIVWHAPALRWGRVALVDPRGTLTRLADPTSAAQLRWTRATAGHFTVGAGELAVRFGDDRVELVAGAAAGYGGTLALARPTELAEPLSIRVHDVQIADVLQGFANGRVVGHGALDGELVVQAGDVIRASLHTRGTGQLQLRDARWLGAAVAHARVGPAIPERIAGALADFIYDHLGVELAAGKLSVAIRGRGRRLPQALDIVVNVRHTPETS